jgi:hypothetical protein
MRFLLVIPAFLLFLSNVPFIHKMDREEMMAVMKKDGCCRKSESKKGSCGAAAMKEEKSSCGKQEQSKKCSSDDKGEMQCGMQNESTCICICCFQFAAPDQLSNRFQFGYDDLQQSLAVYLQLNWKDPLLSLPWQPPDGV